MAATTIFDPDPDGLYAEHIGFIVNIAKKIQRKLPWRVELGEMIGDGLLGLVQARNRYRPQRGTKFFTWAYPRICGAIRDGLTSREQARGCQRGTMRPAHASLDEVRGFPARTNRLADVDARDALEVALRGSELRPEERALLELYHMEGWTDHEIGELVGRRALTILRHRHKALEKVRRAKVAKQDGE